MNAITGIENLVRQPSILQCPYFKVYYDKIEDKNKLRDNHNIKDCTIEECERQIRSLIDDFSESGCNFVFHFTESTGQTALKGGYKVQFYLPARSGLNGHPGIGYLSKEEQTEAINKALAEFKLQLSLDQKEKEIVELKKQIRGLQPTATDRVVTRLGPILEPPVINAIVKKLFDVDVPMDANKIGSAGNNQTNEEAQKIAEDALTILTEDDPDFHITLQKLAELKRTNPEKYKLAKSML